MAQDAQFVVEGFKSSNVEENDADQTTDDDSEDEAELDPSN